EFYVLVTATANQPAYIHLLATMAPNQVPVPGKYDNLYYFANGQPYRTEPAVYNPATGVFTIARPAGALFPSQVTFQPGDIPAPADSTRTGWTQPGVFRSRAAVFVTTPNQRAPSRAGADIPIPVFPGLLGLNVVPPGAPLSYRIPVIAPGGGL